MKCENCGKETIWKSAPLEEKEIQPECLECFKKRVSSKDAEKKHA